MLHPLNLKLAFVVFVLSFTFLACAEPVALSEAVSVKLSGIKEGDVKNGQASSDKNINTESGNPYATFLQSARYALNGDPIGSIEVDGVIIRIHSDSKGVSGIETIFSSLEVFISTSDTTLSLGQIENPTGTSAHLENIENGELYAIQNELVQGSFDIGVRGQTQPNLPEDFELKLTVEATFSAYR